MIADALAELADDPDRLLCLTSHAKALSEFMLGSTAAGVIRQATHHVLVVGPNARVDDVRFESIVVCVDGSPLSEQIMGPAVDWADGLGMKCWLLEVLDGDGVPTPDVVETTYVHRLAEQWRDERPGARLGGGPRCTCTVDRALR